MQPISDKSGIKLCHLTWKAVSKALSNCETSFKDNKKKESEAVNMAFANSEDTEEMYPLTIAEIAEAQHADKNLCKFFKRGSEKLSTTHQYQLSLIEIIQQKV